MIQIIRRALPAALCLTGLAACDASRTVEPAAPDANAAIARTPALRWRVVDLGAPTVPLQFGFSPQGLSTAGHVTGQGRLTSGFTHAISVSPTGVWTVKRPLPGDAGTFPGGINRRGVQVGISVLDRAYSELEAVIWDAAGNPTKIPGLPRSSQEFAGLINDRGYVVGETTLWGSATAQPFVWHRAWPAVRALQLPDPGASFGTSAMNNRGQIAGNVRASGTDGDIPVVWDTTGARRDLPVPAGAASAQATAINDAGMVGGVATLADGTLAGWSWTARRGAVLYHPPAGYVAFYVTSIDNEGRIYFAASRPDFTQVFFVIVNGRMSEIPTIDGGTVTGVVALNGIMLGKVTVNSVLHPTLWIPRD
jgi:uncharacterized membrane protein